MLLLSSMPSNANATVPSNALSCYAYPLMLLPRHTPSLDCLAAIALLAALLALLAALLALPLYPRGGTGMLLLIQ